ncbi:MAG: cation transporter, partial [Lachnospiraceae bacterium]|nr:cation transporter [Lachnospiraceae bacterium]
MLTILSRIFLPGAKDYHDPQVRKVYGILCSAMGIFLNLVLFSMKLIAGIMTSSVAISADAFNNLSDAGSSVISFVGILCAGKPSDKEHPFGHGRMEYIAGFIVSMLILLLGIELLEDSADKVIHPVEIEINSIAVAFLVLSVFIKVYMMCYNYGIGKKTDSSVLKATAYDSFGDVISTTVVLISIGILKWTGKNADGFAGIFVAVFVIYTGIQAARE